MNDTSIRLSQQYEAALRSHVKSGAPAGLPLARRIGIRAAAKGLGALDLARMHDRALDALNLSGSRDGVLKHTNAFFAEAFAPVAQVSRPVCEAASQLRRLKKDLRRRTRELASSQRMIKQGLVERTALKDALRKQAEHHAKFAEESLDLQQCLQNLARGFLSAQESDRATISRKLHDEVAQALLGIQVRLVDLSNEAARNTLDFKKEIASTQRLVEKSAKTLDRSTGGLR